MVRVGSNMTGPSANRPPPTRQYSGVTSIPPSWRPLSCRPPIPPPSAPIAKRWTTGRQNVPSSPLTESSRPPMQRPKPYSRPSPPDSGTEICRRFNRGSCLDPIQCRYRHICSVPECHKPGHAAYTCPLRQETLRPRIGPPLK